MKKSDAKSQTISSQEENEIKEQESISKDSKKEKYFLIIYPTIKKENSDNLKIINSSKTVTTPKLIYSREEEIKSEKDVKEKYSYIKVFKFNIKSEQNDNKYTFEFNKEKENYVITINSNNNSFIYEIDLKKGNKILKRTAKKEIDQKNKDFLFKFETFKEALNKNKEENKIDLLLEEAIEFYSKEQNFKLLITLFVQVYDKKNLCNKLISDFKEMRIKNESYEKYFLFDENNSNYLEQYKEKIKNILEESDELIKNNGYPPLEFYGIILCYLNKYDHDNFIEIINKLLKLDYKTLYEILLIYNNYLPNPIYQDLDFFKGFFEYIISNTDFSGFVNALKYIKEVNIYIDILDKTKEQIFEKYINSEENKFEPIKIDSNLKLNKEEENKEIEKLITLIKSIIYFSKDKNILLIYLSSDFWKNILKEYNEPTELNIDSCYKLRELFKAYNDLINIIYKENKTIKYKIDINKYYETDEFAFQLNNIINKYIEENKELKKEEILGFIFEFNPYYQTKNEDEYRKYSINRDLSIFDKLEFDEDIYESSFIETFKEFNLEKVFKDKLTEFLDKIISKITNIDNFGLVMKLINKESLGDKLNHYITKLKEIYEKLDKKDIEKWEGKELEEKIEIIINFIEIISEKEKNKNEIIEKYIKDLNNKVSYLICIKLMKNSKNGQYESMIKFIIEKAIDNLDKNGNNILGLIDSFDKNSKDYYEFLDKLMGACKFDKDIYYSNGKNTKIDLIYELFVKDKLDKNNKKYEDLKDLMSSLYNDLNGTVSKVKLEEFLKNEKKEVIKRLDLIKIIYTGFDPEKKYSDLQTYIQEINENIKDLIFIENMLLIFLNESKIVEIKTIKKIIKGLEDECIKTYRENKQKIEELKQLKVQICDKIDKVKDFLFFQIIFDNTCGIDQEKRFNLSMNKLDNIKKLIENKKSAQDIYNENKEIFNKIKMKLSVNEKKANKLIMDMKKYFNIEDEGLIKDLNIIFKSKKIELDIKSIIYFFKNLKVENGDIDKKLTSDYEKLSEKTLEEIKKDLEKLKDDKIYDFEDDTNRNYFKLFTSLYEKNDLFEFLLSNIDKEKEIEKLKERLEPTNRTITIKNIDDCIKCISVFKEFKDLNDTSRIFDYIKDKNRFTDKKIENFENFSKAYNSVIELEINKDSDKDLKKIYDIIKMAKFSFRQENEVFTYGENENEITMEELIILKNKIPPFKEKNLDKEDKDDILKSKVQKLIYFKKIISNLEIIYDSMEILRQKGNFLPIEIIVKIEYENEKGQKEIYENLGRKMNFDEIKKFLFTIKSDYISQLDSNYKEKKYLRFLYGKLFRSIMRHVENNENINDILRLILNKSNNKDNIKDINIQNEMVSDDYLNDYKEMTRNSIKIIANYITALFDNNSKDYYKKISFKKSENNFRGIYMQRCENESMEEFIINLFFDKINTLPISLNILICNNETSSEEIQAFFYRSILCEENTLFVVELNDSFSEFQQNIMNNYINQLLAFQKEQKENETAKKYIDSEKTYLYLNSCIVFVYEGKNKSNISVLNELGKFDKLEFGYIRRIKQYISDQNKNDLDNNITNRINNVNVYTSNICGLGKTYQIRKNIYEKKKIYYYFPLGGVLNKNIIYEKLYDLLKRVNKEKKYENIAIHLDLYESEQITVINEFLLSFLITKFYINKENIIYIPNDIEIYIEIQNCFDNYFEKFGILKIFHRINITIDNIPKFYFFDFDKEPFILKQIFGKKKEREINDFIKKYIGMEKYSYHQLKIFVKLLIYVFKNNKNININDLTKFSESSKYFTRNGFIKLLQNDNHDIINNKIDKKNYIDLLSELYDEDFQNKNNYKNPLTVPNENGNELIEINLEEKQEYLSVIKQLLNLPNKINEDYGDKKSLKSILEYNSDKYIITDDNFKKMVLLILRIKANIPTIIMGETGSGKTALIKKLYQLINNGKELENIINIHPGISDKDITEKLEEINNQAIKNLNEEIWVFFDEINTSQSLSLITEIFINRTFNGINISNNIRLLGACNPYRKRNLKIENYGLNINIKKENETKLVYVVEPLPQSLLYYVFCFGELKEDDEKIYIKSIIEKLFDKNETKFHEKTRDAIFECHKILKAKSGSSAVSLREIARFLKSVKFFQNYFLVKDEFLNKETEGKEKLYKIISIICSIYLCYYIRLVDEAQRNEFNKILNQPLINLINNIEPDLEKNIKIKNEKNYDIVNKIYYEPLKAYLKDKNIKNFSDFIKLEEEFILDRINLTDGIGKNNLLKENVFLLFVSIFTEIPLIIIGKPGTGKTLSTQLIIKSLKGKNSTDDFFKKYPQIIQTYFQGSESTNPEDIKKLFEIAEQKIKVKKKNENISVILFDEMGLCERSKNNPLKILHSNLEYAGKKEGVSFIGISNYILDAAKINRALILSVLNLEKRKDQLYETARSIVESISGGFAGEMIFKILSCSYYEYKNMLHFIHKLMALKLFFKVERFKKNEFSEIAIDPDFQKLLKDVDEIKFDFHGNRDFYFFIKGIAREASKLGEHIDNTCVSIVEKYIERNFGGIDYEMDLDLNLDLTDIKEEIERIKNILKDKLIKDYNGKIKVSSVFLFKKIYNMVCESNKLYSIYKIDDKNCDKYNINKCISDNINDKNNRYLLLEIKPSLSSLIFQNIKLQNPQKENIVFYEGSPFIDDNNNKEYNFKIISEIQEDAKTDKLIILQNLNQIQSFLYDLYNMNYTIIDEKNYSRICLDNFNEQLTLVNNEFRIIIFGDKKFVNEVDIAFLNRLEKMKISFDKLLNEEENIFIQKIQNEISLNYEIEKMKINYSLKNLLINCGKEEIEGLIYYYMYINKKEKEIVSNEDITKKVYSKIIKMLPQDIICILPNDHKIKKKYFEEKMYYCFEKYIKDKINEKYKISIIYTFSTIGNVIKGANSDMGFMISEIRSENQLKNKIDEIINKKENIPNYKGDNNIVIHFEQFNSNKIQYISNFLEKKYENYKFIFIIYIKRNFSDKNNEDTIYSIPDIKDNINQLFIDNLNAKDDIALNTILGEDIKSIIDNKLNDLNFEFKKVLAKFLETEIKKIGNVNYEKYISEMDKYNDNDFREKIIKKAKELIKKDKKNEFKCSTLLEKLLQINYINENSVDIISCILEYIKVEIFDKYLYHIFKALEDNNILTTFKDINNSKNEKDKLDKKFLNKIKEKSLFLVNMDKNDYAPKFLPNNLIPGLCQFYLNLSYIINKNIAIEYFNEENKFRKKNFILETNHKIFHEREEIFLSSIYNQIIDDEYIFDIINDVSHHLILKDYIINYYLKNTKYNDIFHKNDSLNYELVNILLNLRFGEDTLIIKNNKTEPLKIIILKIIWMESNKNYISKINDIFNYARNIFNNEIKLIDKIKSGIKNEEIQYVTDDEKFTEYSKEVNECYYKVLVSLCLAILSDEIKLDNKINFNIIQENENAEVDEYKDNLKHINIILKDLTQDLNIDLKEIYIIDELLQIIQFKNIRKINLEKLEQIRNVLLKINYIIKKNQNDKMNELIQYYYNLIELFKEREIQMETDKTYSEKYYNTLRYIVLQEIKKVKDNTFRGKVLETIIRDKEIIKSNFIFEVLLEDYLPKNLEGFKEIKNKLLNGNDDVIKTIDSNLGDNQNNILSETILYLFEKITCVFLDKYLNIENNALDDEQTLNIFKECMKYLKDYMENNERIRNNNKIITKLFCLAYIRVYCFVFILLFDDIKRKFNKAEDIIEAINNNDLKDMIKLYIYKVIYYRNTKNMDVFIKKSKYKLDKYNNFNQFIKIRENIIVSDYEYKTLDNDNYKKVYETLEIYKKDGFKNRIEEINNINIDNFYFATYNLFLSNFKNDDFEKSEIYKNYYNNICLPLFGEDKKLLPLINIIFNPEEFSLIQSKYKFLNIELLLSGYRYCINELKENKPKGVYSILYDETQYTNDKYFPGIDYPHNDSYFELYNQVTSHFINRPDEGCYVHLCEKGYYQSIPSGFPEYTNNNENKCKSCGENISSKTKNYLRIFKDREELNKIEQEIGNKKKLREINYMTFDEFKQKMEIDKGFHIIDEKNKQSFLQDGRKIRKLSPISYRLLNFIFYSHLFFSRCAKKSLDINLNYDKILCECYVILQIELSKINDFPLNKFLNYIFKDLFESLNSKEYIQNYEELFQFEELLESLVQNNLKELLLKDKNFKEIFTENKGEDKFSSINLLEEKYDKSYYSSEQYPYYEYFYYSEYFTDRETYINALLRETNNNKKYPVTGKYLKYRQENKINEKNKIKDKYTLDNLNLFNNILNLFNNEYSHIITEEYAKNILLKDSELYKNEKYSQMIKRFITFYNNLEIKDSKGNLINLDENTNNISDFFIDENNRFGKSYKDIYKNFIKKQNEEIDNLLEIKINKEIFDKNCKNKINIQEINENDIFSFNSINDFCFTKLIFAKNNCNSNTSDINYSLIESNMTDLFLRNKKLLSENIIEFSYFKSEFSNNIYDEITNFKKTFKQDKPKKEEKNLFNIIEGDNKKEKYKILINDFIFLIRYLNGLKKNKTIKNLEISETSTIYDIINKLEKNDISEDFILIFKDKKDLKIKNLANIFENFLGLIFNDVYEEIKKYQISSKLEEVKIKLLDEYYKNKPLINKEALKTSIRLLMSLILFLEKDKEKKIKNNKNNLVYYLYIIDFWNKNLLKNKKFLDCLKEIKGFNIPINQIIYLYDYLNKNEKDNVPIDIKNNKNEKKREEEPKIKEINNSINSVDIYENDENKMESYEMYEDDENEESEGDFENDEMIKKLKSDRDNKI